MKTLRTSAARNSCTIRRIFGMRTRISPDTFIILAIILFLSLFGRESFAQGIGISESSITPNANSILELRSTLRGFLAPRMTTIQRGVLGAIPPAAGMLVYDTDTKSFWYYDNGGWNAIAAGTSVGTVTNFSAGTLSPLFTTSVATSTSTPVLSFVLTNAGAYSIFGNNTNASAAPAYFTPTLASGLFQNQGTTTTVLHGNAAGNPSWGQVGLTTDVTGALPIGNGGTGQITKAPAFDALSPMTAGGDLIYGGASGTGTRLANGAAGQVLQSNGTTLAPTWGGGSGLASFRTQATAASTLTLVVGDAYAQQFTGSTAAQIVKLPTTSVAAGQSFLIMNNSTVPITLQSSGANTIQILGPNAQVIVTALVTTPTTAANWSAVSSSYYFQNGFRTQATAASTLTLVVGDAYAQEFTGSTAAQIVQLPTTSVGAGQSFLIMNNSTVPITINSSGANLVQTVPPSSNVIVTALVSTPTTAANWESSTSISVNAPTLAGISAAGIIQGTATALTNDYNEVTTVTAGSATGVVLPAPVVGRTVYVVNKGSTNLVTLNVYPASTNTIDGQAASVAYTLPPSAAMAFKAISATKWYTVNSLAGPSKVQFLAQAVGGTYTPTPGTKTIVVELIGGGASGGGAVISAAVQGSAGGGGGAGGYTRKLFTDITSAGAILYTIGAVVTGTAGVIGTVGVTTTFDNNNVLGAGTVTAIGGAAGPSGLATGANKAVGGGLGGAAGANGDFMSTGGVGSPGLVIGAGLIGIGGDGGNSFLGGGGLGVAVAASSTNAGNPATNYGGGGSGAVNLLVGGTPAKAGGNGGVGAIIVYEYK